MAGTVVYLSSFVVPELDACFIVEHYGEIYARLPALLRDQLGDAPLLRALLGCLRHVFSAFSGASDWTERQSLQELFTSVLALCVEERPKVRRCAQDCVTGTLLSSSGQAHPALPLATQMCKLVLQAATRKDSGRALHVAPLLRRLVPGLDQCGIDGLLGPAMQVAGLGSTHLTVALFGFFEELCRVQSEEESLPLVRVVQLNQGEARKILDGLQRLQPASWELAELSAAWLASLGAVLAHPALSGRLEMEVQQRTILSALASTQESVHLACQLAMSRLRCPPALLLGALQAISAPEQADRLPYLLAILRDQVMALTAATDLVLCPERAAVLDAVASFYERKGFAALRTDVTKAIGDHVRVFGSAAVLACLPLGLEGGASQSRAWLLPVLKESVSNDQLLFLCTALLPLAERLQAKATGFREAGKLGDAKVYETIAFQLWSLVPSYLRYPTDLAAGLPLLAPRLAACVTADPLLRPALLNALAALVQRCRQYEDDREADGGALLALLRPPSAADNAAGLEALRSLAPNLLPTVFNLLGVTAAEQRAYLLHCIQALLDVSAPALVAGYFERVAGHLQASTEQDAAMLELCCTMVRFLEAPAYEQLLGLAMRRLHTAAEPGLQKAAYKAAHLVLAHELHGPALLAAQAEALEAALQASAPLVEVGAVRKCRFRLLLGLMPQLPDAQLHWVPLVLPETVLGTKEVNQKARLLAFELLLAMARRMARGGLISGERAGLPADTPASLDEFLAMVLAGLAGRTPHMISATVLSLARLLFDLAAILPADSIAPLLADVLLLFGSPSREIVKAAFGFVKVAVVALPPALLAPHLPNLIGAILAWSGEHAMHFKVRVRHLLERLVRRFGYDQVAACIPPEHHRLIVNIRKRKERLRRKKQQQLADHPEGETGAETDGPIDMDALTQAALSRQTSMVTRRGISTTAQATRPSARFEAALYDSESELDDDEHLGEEGEEPVMVTAEDDLETALSKRLSMRSRALTAKTSKTSGTKASEKNTTAKKTPGKKRMADGEDEEFRINAEGKMIIDDSDAEVEDEDEGIVVDESAQRLYEQSLATFQRPGKHVKFSQKRSSSRADESEGETEQHTAAVDARSRATNLSRLSRVTSRPGARVKHGGSEFKAKRGAQGDTKAKGSRFEPYAYVPLQRAAKGAKQGGGRYFLNNKK